MGIKWKMMAVLMALALALSPKLVMAAPPPVATGYLVENLSFDACIQRAPAALRGEGFEVTQPTLPAGATLNTVGARLGDYSAVILCGPKQVIVFVVAGPDGQTAAGYLNSLEQSLRQQK
jgi:hypothetical protein